MNFSGIILFFLVTIFVLNMALSSGESSDPEEVHGVHVASWNWDHVGVFITITAFIVFSGLAKVGMFVHFSFITCNSIRALDNHVEFYTLFIF